MSAQFYSVHPTAVQNAMGGTHLYTPQSIFQHTMNHQGTSQQTDAPWLRMPQVPPMSMPWSVPSFQQPDLVRFTGEKSSMPFGPVIHQKRKLETPDIVNTRPTKQFITEEKMAQHFQDLHISANGLNMQGPGPSSVNSSQNSVHTNDLSLDLSHSIDTNEMNTQPRLIISDEIKRLQQEPILPSSLLSKLERPSMALVLWEPPSKHLRLLSTPRDTTIPPLSSNDNNNNGMNSGSISNNNNNNNNNSNNNNNNESIPNLNQTMDVNISDPNLEPMDL